MLESRCGVTDQHAELIEFIMASAELAGEAGSDATWINLQMGDELCIPSGSRLTEDSPRR